MVFYWLATGGVESIRPDTVSESWLRQGYSLIEGTSEHPPLLAVCRVAMFHSSVIALVATATGVGLAFLIGTLIAWISPPKNRRREEHRTDLGAVVPIIALLVILLAGTGGDSLVLGIGLVVIVALFGLEPVIRWYRQAESGPDVTASIAAGVSRPVLLRKRFTPAVIRKCFGLAAQLFPRVILIEISLSFLGLIDDQRLSCGALLNLGRDTFLAAPELTMWPGLTASIVVAIFALYGWWIRIATGAHRIPCFP